MIEKCPICGGSHICFSATQSVSGTHYLFLMRCADCGLDISRRVPITKDMDFASEVAAFRELWEKMSAEQEKKTEMQICVYDREETYTNCTVQVLTNTFTGETSIGWWCNDGNDESEDESGDEDAED